MKLSYRQNQQTQRSHAASQAVFIGISVLVLAGFALEQNLFMSRISYSSTSPVIEGHVITGRIIPTTMAIISNNEPVQLANVIIQIAEPKNPEMEMAAQGHIHTEQTASEATELDPTIHIHINETETGSAQQHKVQQKMQPRILVVYSGPATLTEGNPSKNELYIRNLEFFIKNALDCTIQDFIIVLGHNVGPIYRDQLAALDQVCQKEYSHSIIMITRDNVCFDMESVRLVMHGNITDFLSYDYFVYVNCGTTGPVMPKNKNKGLLSWTSAFIDKMDEKVKMVGLSINCLVAHVQSMVYALDKVAMKLIKESDCVFDCRPIKARNPNITDDDIQKVIIAQYEMGMSQKLLANGFGITSLMRPEIVTEENRQNCTERDTWLTSRLTDKYGKVPSLGEIMFFKTSRILTPETAALINFTGNIGWNW